MVFSELCWNCIAVVVVSFCLGTWSQVCAARRRFLLEFQHWFCPPSATCVISSLCKTKESPCHAAVLSKEKNIRVLQAAPVCFKKQMNLLDRIYQNRMYFGLKVKGWWLCLGIKMFWVAGNDDFMVPIGLLNATERIWGTFFLWASCSDL